MEKRKWKNGHKQRKTTAEAELLSPSRTLFTVNGEIECMEYLMAFIFIVQH